MSIKLSREWIQKAEEDYQAALLLSPRDVRRFLTLSVFIVNNPRRNI